MHLDLDSLGKLSMFKKLFHFYLNEEKWNKDNRKWSKRSIPRKRSLRHYHSVLSSSFSLLHAKWRHSPAVWLDVGPMKTQLYTTPLNIIMIIFRLIMCLKIMFDYSSMEIPYIDASSWRGQHWEEWQPSWRDRAKAWHILNRYARIIWILDTQTSKTSKNLAF